MSLFVDVQQAPADPILGLTERFNADTNPRKVNLGVGVYQDGTGKVPLLNCVRTAEDAIEKNNKPRPYLPIDGMSSYDKDVQKLVFGADHPAVTQGRIVTIQSLGGTGALKVGADFHRFLDPDAALMISDPSWENHQAIFARAGFQVSLYRYYDAANRGVDVEGMLADLAAAERGTVIVLHGCCHNPTGYDLADDDWTKVIEVIKERDLVPLIDLAYQGLAVGLAEDVHAVRAFLDAGLTFYCASSFSKNFSLYGERVGALSIVCADAAEAKRVLSQVKIVIRTNYSNPPTHGAAVVSTVLEDEDLRELWVSEVAMMRSRIKAMRKVLVRGLAESGVQQDMSFITTQRGMFSYSGLIKDQMARLRDEFSIYGTDKGRICVAALNDDNIDYVCSAIAQVLD